MGVISQFRGLPRQIYLLSFVRTIMAMGTFVFAFISLMASSTLGFNEFQIGNVMFFVAVAAVIGSLSGGKLADAFGRKKMFLLADGLAVLTIVLAGFFCKTAVALVFMVLSYAFSNMATPIIAAMITDYSDEKNRAECFSILYLSQNIGFAIGPSIGGLLFHNYMQWAFFGQGILFALSGVWMCLFVKESYVPAKRQENAGSEREYGNRAAGQERLKGADESLLRSLWHRPVVFAFVLCLIALTACYQEISFMLPLQFAELFGIEAGSRYSGFIWSVNALVCVTGTPLIISASKKNNQLLNIALASLLYAAGFAVNGFVGRIGLFYAAVVIWTTGEILVSTGAGVFIANYAPETHRARYQSLYEVARGFGRGIGPNLFGFYLLTHSFRQAWTLTSFACVAAGGCVLALYFAERRIKARGKETPDCSEGSARDAG